MKQQIKDWMTLKAFADNKLNVNDLMISVYDRKEKIVEHGENAVYQHFLPFSQCFQKAFFHSGR